MDIEWSVLPTWTQSGFLHDFLQLQTSFCEPFFNHQFSLPVEWLTWKLFLHSIRMTSSKFMTTLAHRSSSFSQENGFSMCVCVLYTCAYHMCENSTHLTSALLHILVHSTQLSPTFFCTQVSSPLHFLYSTQLSPSPQLISTFLCTLLSSPLHSSQLSFIYFNTKLSPLLHSFTSTTALCCPSLSLTISNL